MVSELKQGDPILLSVTRDKKIWIDKNEVKREQLADALTSEMARMPGSPILRRVEPAADKGQMWSMV